MSTLGTLLQHLPAGSEFGKTMLGQVNWEGDGSSFHVSLLNNFPFLCHTLREEDMQTASLELLVLSDAQDAKASCFGDSMQL